MKRSKFFASVAMALAMFVATHAAANQFANPGFEDPITFDGPPFVGFWEGFSGNGASSGNSDVMPRTGDMHVDLSINNADQFAGVFQDVANLSPGSEWNVMGWHKAASDPLDLIVEIRIEWRDSVSDMEISRTPNSTPVPTSDYTMFSLTEVVPAGADTARVVYAVQSFGTNPLGSGTVFIDDFAFKVPEPATLTLLGLAMIGGSTLTRRRNV